MNDLPVEVTNDMPVGWEDLFSADTMADDLSAGAGSTGFNVLSIRGSKFRIKCGDEEHPILTAEGDPVPSLEVVLLKANPNVSKIYYKKSYAEGDAESPDCYSTDGDQPDAGSLHPQAKSCQTCEHSKWGSRITESGAKGKACADSRRIAVWIQTQLPEGVQQDEPVMLRIPAVSLKDLATYGKVMASKNAPYNRIVTRIKFDINVSFPKLTYSAVRPVPVHELPMVAKLIMDERTEAILSESTEAAEVAEPAKTNGAVNTDFEEEVPVVVAPEPVAKKPVAKKAAAKKPAAKKPVAVKPAPEPKNSALEDDLDGIIADLEGLD